MVTVANQIQPKGYPDPADGLAHETTNKRNLPETRWDKIAVSQMQNT